MMLPNRIAPLAGAVLLVVFTAVAPLAAQNAPTPARVATMRPVEVVRHVLADSAALRLTPAQLRSLTELEARVLESQEPRRVYTGVKPFFYREVPGTTPEQALRQALAVLRYGQRDHVLARLDGDAPVPVEGGASGREMTS